MYLSESMHILSLCAHFLRPGSPPVLRPCFPSFLFHLPFLQSGATAGNAAVSGGWPGVAAQCSEAAQECDSHLSQGSGDAGDWQSPPAAQVGLTCTETHNSLSTVETLPKFGWPHKGMHNGSDKRNRLRKLLGGEKEEYERN